MILPEILQYDFMIRAFFAGLILAVVAPTIGFFFVVRRYAVMADTLSHVSLAGIATGLFLGISTVWSALIACILAVLGIEFLRDRRTLSGDTILSLFLFGGLALGVILIGFRPGGGVNVSNFLFGSVLTITTSAVQQIALIGTIVMILIALLWKSFFAISLDEDVAKATGLPVRILNRTLAILGAATIAISINVVGVLLIGALMVIPVLAAMQFKKGFQTTWVLALCISFLSIISGLTISFYFNLASGATVVLMSIGLFFISAVSNTNK